jgi:hypothetical protein
MTDEDVSSVDLAEYVSLRQEINTRSTIDILC